MYQFKSILKTDLINLFTNPMWLIMSTIFPILLILILGFLGSGTYGEVVTSYDYFSITMMIYGALNAATFSANSFMEKRIESANMRIIYAPIRAFYIHFSKVLATFIFTCVCYTIVGVVLYVLLGVNFGGAFTLHVWFLIMLVDFFAACIGVLMCCIFKSEEATNQIISNVIALLAILGGLFFPINGFGKAMEMISNILPVKWVITALFQLIYDHNFTLYLPTCCLLIVLSVMSVLFSVKLFKMEDYL